MIRFLIAMIFCIGTFACAEPPTSGSDTMKSSEQDVYAAYEAINEAMIKKDRATLERLLDKDLTFTHMSGMTQSREEYFADIADGSLYYFTIGIANPVIEVDGDSASITFTSVLNANAYGARGTFRMKGTHHYERRDGEWIAVNG